MKRSLQMVLLIIVGILNSVSFSQATTVEWMTYDPQNSSILGPDATLSIDFLINWTEDTEPFELTFDDIETISLSGMRENSQPSSLHNGVLYDATENLGGTVGAFSVRYDSDGNVKLVGGYDDNFLHLDENNLLRSDETAYWLMLWGYFYDEQTGEPGFGGHIFNSYGVPKFEIAEVVPEPNNTILLCTCLLGLVGTLRRKINRY